MRQVLGSAFRRLTPRELLESREDLQQTALLRVLELESREKEQVRTASYLWHVAFTTIADELRRRRRGREEPVEMEHLEARVAELHPPQVTGVPGLADALRACLEQLPESRRLPVVLHLQGFAPSEACRVLKAAGKRVENLTYRGLIALRRCLAEKGHTP
jgi:RNA polymerase sigma factor (sigma-70 family)